jgi:hypothetical protein
MKIFHLGVRGARALEARRGADSPLSQFGNTGSECAGRQALCHETFQKISRFNATVTVFMQDLRKAQPEMTSVKAALLTFAMLSAIVFGGLGIYASDAANDHNAVDGYGVTAALR